MDSAHFTAKQLREKLRFIQPLISVLAKQNTESPSFSDLNELTQLRIGVDALENLGLFETLTSRLTSSAIFTTSNDWMRIQTVEANNIATTVTQLQEVVANFSKTLDKVLPAETEDSLNIKLPPDVRDFGQLAEVAKQIDIALSQIVYLPEVAGSIVIESVENGSIWFNVKVGAAAVLLLSTVAWSSAVVYKKANEGRLIEEQIRALEIQNASLEDVRNAQKKQLEIVVEGEARYVFDKHFSDSLPENLERVKNSIKIFADLLARGAEVKPALTTPEEVTNLFPDMSKLTGVESRTKLLTSSEQ